MSRPEAPAPALSIVIPAFNEAGGLLATVAETVAALRDLDIEIVVVDDASTDRTADECEKLRALDVDVQVLRHATNRGKGAALRTGAAAARGALIAFLDADLDIHPRQVKLLLARLEESDADGVVGSRYDPASNVRTPLLRRSLSQIYRRVRGVLFSLDVSDTQVGLKVFKADALKRVLVCATTDRFAFDLELIVTLGRFGYRIVDVPVAVTFQRAGVIGRVGPGAWGRMIADTLRIFHRTSFWTLMDPGWTAIFWMGALGLSLMTAGASLALFTTAPRGLAGAAIVVATFLGGTAALQLNKILLAAFGRVDSHGLQRMRLGPVVDAVDRAAGATSESAVPVAIASAYPSAAVDSGSVTPVE